MKARLVEKPEEYRWSSVHAHLSGTDLLGIVDASKLLNLCGDWKLYLKQSQKEPEGEIDRHTRTGRPLGSASFIKKAERLLNRNLQKKKPGPKAEQDR